MLFVVALAWGLMGMQQDFFVGRVPQGRVLAWVGAVAAVLLVVCVVLVVFATSADAQQNGSCQSPRTVATVGPTRDNTRTPFEVTGRTFRVSYDVTFEDPNAFNALDIEIEDRFGLAAFQTVEESGSDSFIVTEGPGSFELLVNVTTNNGATYTVTVEDCVGTAPGGNDGGAAGGNGGGGVGGDDGSVTAAEAQYKEKIINIPNQKTLADTGGISLGPVLFGLAFLGVGVPLFWWVIRRTS
jgi:hypothetical protein